AGRRLAAHGRGRVLPHRVGGVRHGVERPGLASRAARGPRVRGMDTHESTQHPTLYPIGDVARRTGLSVSAVRFYADEGVVPPAETTPAGHRLYGAVEIARLEFVRTLRELGSGLEQIRRLLTGQT